MAGCTVLNIICYFYLKIQNYKSDLSEFRATTMPRDFIRSFQENQDTNIIRDQTTDLNDRYSNLKTNSIHFTNSLADIADRLQRYQNSVSVADRWLGNSRTTLDNMLGKPVPAETSEIQKQIDDLKVCFHIKNLCK